MKDLFCLQGEWFRRYIKYDIENEAVLGRVLGT
jgi:hypothetical protein